MAPHESPPEPVDIGCRMGEAGDRNRLQTVGEEAWIWKVMAVASNRPFTTKRDQGRGASPSRRAVLGSGTAGAGLLATGCSIFDEDATDRKSTRLNSSHVAISYAVFCLKN